MARLFAASLPACVDSDVGSKITESAWDAWTPPDLCTQIFWSLFNKFSHKNKSGSLGITRSQFCPVPLPQGWSSPTAPLELLL